MKITFDINLIRQSVPSARQRLVSHFGMLFYIAVCGVLLVFLIYRGTEKMVHAFAEINTKAIIQTALYKSHPEMNSEVKSLRNVVNDLKHNGRSLEQINKVLSQRADMGGIILGLVLPLPSQLQLLRLEQDDDKHFTFDIAVPEKMTGVVSSGNLIEKWNVEPLLETKIRDIRSVSSHRRRVGTKDSVVLRFECSAADK